jgi:hypothetical protein
MTSEEATAVSDNRFSVYARILFSLSSSESKEDSGAAFKASEGIETQSGMESAVHVVLIDVS